MSMMHTQINRAISSAIRDMGIPEIQNFMGTLPWGQRDSESGTSTNIPGLSEKLNGLNMNLAKKD